MNNTNKNQKERTENSSSAANVRCNNDNINWKVDTPALLGEITNNLIKGGGVLKIPLNIFRLLLAEVAKRATILDDKEMNKLMIRLALYESPHSKETLDYLNT